MVKSKQSLQKRNSEVYTQKMVLILFVKIVRPASIPIMDVLSSFENTLALEQRRPNVPGSTKKVCTARM